jgi:hypothetical protein
MIHTSVTKLDDAIKVLIKKAARELWQTWKRTRDSLRLPLGM